MKRILLWMIVMLYAGFGNAAPDTYAQYWQEANRAYEAQQYQHAIDNYEKIVADSVADDAVYYNLGSAYYRNKQTGKAVLNYKRALRLNAGNKMARENIAFIHQKTPKAIVALQELFIVKAYHTVLRMISANAWAIVALTCFIATAALVYRIRVKKIRFGYRWLSLSLVLTLLVMSFAFTAYQNNQNRSEGVVCHNNAFLYDKNNMAVVKGSIPEGTVFILSGAEKESRVYITLANGSEGWIDKTDIEII
ncbi:hypothetical protein DBR32_07125 [Taibaiella sp. KBW10]|uniref:tetratricopeptide repeat protein n=1 Tax=Taibaiella sp. KBW10 TaxID=2153357 RepID=UPI000F596971|nr:tetratricopeptide repeat protein [Taibaiella sp. KBW10]RQO31711.1 hypothetical protein DBR32_07125 [Taibaiella sp. KBW10]